MNDNLPARHRALHRLLRIEEQGAFVSRVSPDDTDLDDAREERQAAEYVAGITRLRRRLDFIIDHFYRGEAVRMEPALRQCLRIGLYDLIVLETAPHAAVHEAVELAKRAVRPGAGAVVNGILRQVIRERDNLPEPATGRVVRDLAVQFSQPNWVVRRWLNQFGEDETRALLAAANERPAYALRLNTRRRQPGEFGRMLDDLGVAWRPSTYLDDFVRVDQLQPILRAGWLEDGTCAVQDEAAGLIVRLLDPRADEVVVDAAAAPGGKAVYAAIRMDDRGSLLAIDINASRVDLVRRAAKAHGLHIVTTRAVDLRELAAQPDAPLADRVLLDAPCSGLGVLAKRADLRWRRTEEQITELCALQDDLLDAAARLVSPGGLLVYSTCTIEPDENERRVEAFLARQPEFTAESAAGFVPDQMVTPAGHFLALPHRHGTDGAFGARMRRAAAG